jgi:methyltransferase-like protein 6
MSSSHQQDLSSSSPDILPDVPSPLLAVETEAGIVTPSPEEIEEILRKQNSRRVTAFEAAKLEKEAKKNWDIFYKRNETRFFKDRHWTLREFQEILEWRQQQEQSQSASDNKEVNLQQDGGGRGGPILLEVGCGCGNFIIPLLEEIPLLRAYACDFSPRAVDFVK